MIKNIFPMQLYETHYEGFHNIKEDVTSKIMSLYTTPAENLMEEQFKRYIEAGGYNLSAFSALRPISRKLHNTISIAPVFDFIIHHVNEFWSSMKFYSNCKPVLNTSWVYKQAQGGGIDWHNHSPSTISGVFYINATPEMGNIMFENPSNLLLGLMPFEKPAGQWGPSMFEHEIDVADGKLILFPGWLKHKTLKNKTDTDRIVVAFDFGIAPK